MSGGNQSNGGNVNPWNVGAPKIAQSQPVEQKPVEIKPEPKASVQNPEVKPARPKPAEPKAVQFGTVNEVVKQPPLSYASAAQKNVKTAPSVPQEVQQSIGDTTRRTTVKFGTISKDSDSPSELPFSDIQRVRSAPPAQEAQQPPRFQPPQQFGNMPPTDQYMFQQMGYPPHMRPPYYPNYQQLPFMPPAPSKLTASSTDGKPLFQKAQRKAIVFKDPKTNQVVDLPTRQTSRSSSVANLADAVSSVKLSDSKPELNDSQSNDEGIKETKVDDKPQAVEQTEKKQDAPLKEVAEQSKEKYVEKPAPQVTKEVDVKQPEPIAEAKVERKQEPKPKVNVDVETAVQQAAVPLIEPKSDTPTSMEEGQVEESLQNGHMVTSDGKRVYTIEFMLTLKDKFTARPADLISMEAVLGEGSDPSALRRMSSGRGGDSRRSDNFGSRGRLSRQSSGGGGRGLPPGLNVKPPPQSGRRSSAFGGKSRQSGGKTSQPPITVLNQSENRWVPKKFGGDGQIEHNEKILRQARSLLNKLTVEKFQSITEKMVHLGIDNYELLQDLINLIFDKATDEPKFGEMYAQMCLRLWKNLPPFTESYVQEVKERDPNVDTTKFNINTVFRSILLIQCQAEFEKRADWANAEPLAIRDDMTAEEMAVVAAEEGKRRKAKRRTLGNVKFVGELQRVGMISEKIVHGCIRGLLENVTEPEEEEIECVADLLMTVGEALDVPPAAQLFKQYFSRLAVLAKCQSLSSRIRFKVQDVIELRQRKWVKRADANMINTGPMKLSEARNISTARQSMPPPKSKHQKDADRDRRQTRQLPQRQNSGNGWTSNDVRNNTSNLQSVKSATSVGSADKKDDDKSKSGSTPNMFEVLTSTDSISQSPSTEDLKQRPQSANPVTDLPKDLKKNYEAVEKYLSSSEGLKKDFALAAEDSVQAAVNVVLKVRSNVADDRMNDITLKIFGSLIENMAYESQHLKQLSLDVEERSVDASRVKLEAIGLVAIKLINAQLVDKKLIMDEVLRWLAEMQDADVPYLPQCLGVVLAVLVSEGLIATPVIKQTVQQVNAEYDWTPRYFPDMKREPSRPQYATFVGTFIEGYCLLRKNEEDTKQLLAELTGAESYDAVNTHSFLQLWFGTNEERLKAIPESAIAAFVTDYQIDQLLKEQ